MQKLDFEGFLFYITITAFEDFIQKIDKNLQYLSCIKWTQIVIFVLVI